jgi:hypothetical protein
VIQYALHCEKDHSFEAWFKSASAYDEQRARGIVSCPVCGSSSIDKALMAPAVARSSSDKMAVSNSVPDHARMLELLRQYRQKVLSEAENVGEKFAEEARKIHFEEAPSRGIYGQATKDEVVSLLEDGVEILPLPELPEEHN